MSLAPFCPSFAVLCAKTAKEWKQGVGDKRLPHCSTPYNPEDTRVYMARASKVVIPAGLVEFVCTDSQRASSKATAGVFVVRILLNPVPLALAPHS